MKLRDRKIRKRRRQMHLAIQAKRKRDALVSARSATARARKKENRELSFQMEKRGYVMNGKGGWRRMTTTEKERYGVS